MCLQNYIIDIEQLISKTPVPEIPMASRSSTVEMKTDHFTELAAYNYKCGYCDKKYVRSHSLFEHLQKEHSTKHVKYFDALANKMIEEIK